MTDKQIIIDKSKCKHYWNGNCSDWDNKLIGACDDFEDCYCKMYLRKEQECERLKETIQLQNKMQMEVCEEKNAEIERLKERINSKCFDAKNNNNRCISYNHLAEDYERDLQQLDQLKAENEELTTINARLLGRLEVDKIDTSLVFNLDKELRQKEKEFYTAIQKVVRLKQTLTEIKEIAEDFGFNGTYESYKTAIDQILQKISEVEND